MSAPSTIDHAVAALFRAMIGHARGDAVTVAAARSELVVLAGATEDFEQNLTTAAVDRVAQLCPRAGRDGIERAVRGDVHRHVADSLRLAKTEPWGSG